MGLEVNIKKKVMIMNKRGQKLYNLYQFKLNWKTIEIVDQQTYRKFESFRGQNLDFQKFPQK